MYNVVLEQKTNKELSIEDSAPYKIFLKDELFYPKYGALYNFYAATDARGIASSGWHVPTYTEVATMQTFLGGAASAYDAYREVGTTYWLSAVNETNSAKFNARGSGFRDRTTGAFSSFKALHEFWTSTSTGTNTAWSWKGHVSGQTLNGSNYYKRQGNAIRLLKDSTTLSDGEEGTYTGNDGKVYRTICIGTQEWLADNLVEWKYANGDLIPFVESAASWVTLLSGAMCYYDNDVSYSY